METVVHGDKVLARVCEGCGLDEPGEVFQTWVPGAKLEDQRPFCAPCASARGRSPIWPPTLQQATIFASRLSTEDKLALAASLTESALDEIRSDNALTTAEVDAALLDAEAAGFVERVDGG